jgi:streptogramin lyase
MNSYRMTNSASHPRPSRFICRWLIVSLLSIWIGPTAAQVDYRFERFFPVLQQPWYFDVGDLAVDRDGKVYAADLATNRIMIFTREGRLTGQIAPDIGREGPARKAQNQTAVAIGPDQDIFVLVGDTAEVHRFDSEGRFVRKWSLWQNGPADRPESIAVDALGNVYTTEFLGLFEATGENGRRLSNGRIQKFSGDGELLMTITFDTSVEDFTPRGLAVADDGLIYAAVLTTVPAVCSGDNIALIDGQIQVFSAEGERIRSWRGETETVETCGNVATAIVRPASVAIEADGSILVGGFDLGFRKNKVFRYDPFGNELGRYTVLKVHPLNFLQRFGLDVGPDGNWILGLQDTIDRYRPDGTRITRWSSAGDAGGFSFPSRIAVGGMDRLYVTDYTDPFTDAVEPPTFFTTSRRLEGRIQQFDHQGRFLREMAPVYNDETPIYADASGDLWYLEFYRIETDEGFPYEAFLHHLDRDGNEVAVIPVPIGDRPAVRSSLDDFEISADGRVFIVDGIGQTATAERNGGRVIVMDLAGNLITEWPAAYPTRIALTPDGDLLTLSVFPQATVTRYDDAGNELDAWTIDDSELASGTGFFGAGLAVDDDGRVFLSFQAPDPEQGLGSVREYTLDGTYVQTFADIGFLAGQVQEPLDMGLDSDGNLYVVDTLANRVQRLNRRESSVDTRAIVVAGGGPYPGNSLWEATQTNANFAYRTLNLQGFSKDEIFYLSSDVGLDLDLNGEADDVDADATNANLGQALTEWAAGAESVIVYLVDHGGDETFRMSGTETLSAAQLDGWLAQLQGTLSGDLTVVYDACQSGSFVSRLAGPGRTVITSTSPGESAYFVSQGSLSFSNQFWTHVFNGERLQDAYSLARGSTTATFPDQNPLLDANGNGVANEPADFDALGNTFIGNGTEDFGSRPEIASVSAPRNIVDTSTATLVANGVTDADGIARVYAVVRNPGYTAPAPNTPITELPQVDFQPVGGDRYEVTYDRFNEEGTYQLTVYATDAQGNSAVPKVAEVTVGNPLRRKAVIIAAGETADGLWPAIEVNAELAYEALKQQGYTDADIEYLSASATAGVDTAVSPGNIAFAVTDFADGGGDLRGQPVGPLHRRPGG